MFKWVKCEDICSVRSCKGFTVSIISQCINNTYRQFSYMNDMLKNLFGFLLNLPSLPFNKLNYSSGSSQLFNRNLLSLPYEFFNVKKKEKIISKKLTYCRFLRKFGNKDIFSFKQGVRLLSTCHLPYTIDPQQLSSRNQSSLLG